LPLLRGIRILDGIEFATFAGIKVILDFVPNHSSDEHEWFVKSAQKDERYSEYYVWHDGKLDEQERKIPPNNWVSPEHTSLMLLRRKLSAK
jgi:glycosidase